MLSPACLHLAWRLSPRQMQDTVAQPLRKMAAYAFLFVVCLAVAQPGLPLRPVFTLGWMFGALSALASGLYLRTAWMALRHLLVQVQVDQPVAFANLHASMQAKKLEADTPSVLASSGKRSRL